VFRHGDGDHGQRWFGPDRHSRALGLQVTYPVRARS